jgi:hypothetical protein
MELAKIQKSHKYIGYRLEIFNKTFEFFRNVWTKEDKSKSLDEIHIVSYTLFFPSGHFNLRTLWNQKKGDYWEKDGKKYYVKFTKNRIVIGKFSVMWSLKFKKNKKLDEKMN